MIQEEHTIHFADHEVFLSFNDDQEGIDFREWWETQGVLSFKVWRHYSQAEHR